MHRACVLALATIDALPGGPRIPFDLARPTQVIELPRELREVSALTDVDDHTVACLHDEAARLYLVDLRDGRVKGVFPFGGPGDMEGLTRVDDAYYVLRSDGLLFHLTMRPTGLVLRDTVRLALPQGDLEGLGHDPIDDILLVAPKGMLKGSPKARDIRRVYGYDHRNGRLLPTPVLDLSVEDLAGQARRMGLSLPTRVTDKGRVVPALKLRFSSVAVDPWTGHYHLLSAVDHVLLVVDRRGELVDLHLLDPVRCPKPEGITFLPGGDMLISTEGEGVPPALFRYARITPPAQSR